MWPQGSQGKEMISRKMAGAAESNPAGRLNKIDWGLISEFEMQRSGNG